MTLSRYAKAEVLRAAMHGYSAQIEDLARKRREAEQMLGDLEKESPITAKPMARPTHRKRRMSKEGRKAIVEAARRRWAKFRAQKRAAAAR